MAKKKTTKTKKPAIKPNDIHPCDPGYIWSDLQKKCVPDIG